MDNWLWNRTPQGTLYATWPVPGREIIGARFRNARLKAGIGQRRLSELSGVSQTTISRLERGLNVGMRLEAAMRIAAVLGSNFPFGACPHRHDCDWPSDPRSIAGRRRVRGEAS